ncbi:MAG: rRNA maturation RNase YbeY [Flavobacteriia bacterium]|nr:MAG: rRNA maturation RNase YbeY [Flavobacteriia bacterium]
MISYFSEINYELKNPENLTTWIEESILKEGFVPGEINYIFCDDECLLQKNIKYLSHNTLTDIISFDYTENNIISGDIFISIERVKENAQDLGHLFEDELCRVMIHGVLHYCGYKDKTEKEQTEMTAKEDYYLSLRTF